MTRRSASWAILKAAASASAADFFAKWLPAAPADAGGPAEHAGHAVAPADPHDWSQYKPRFFSADEYRAVEIFSEILIPSDESPGARAAQVAPFTDFVVDAAAEFAPEMQQQWRAAMAFLKSRRFHELGPREQFEMVTEMARGETDHSNREPATEAYRLIKDMTVHAFYTSRIGLIDVLEYQGLAYLTQFPGCTHPEHRGV